METKNILYTDNIHYTEGIRLFELGKFNEANIIFEELLFELPNSKKTILGRIAMTNFKLQDFEKAKNQFKEAIVLNPEREKEYSLFLAECYYGLKQYDKTLKYCDNYLYKYGNSEEINSIKNKILPFNEYEILLNRNDVEYSDIDCADAFYRLSKKFEMINDLDSALYFANKRIQYNDADSTDAFIMLGSIYEKNNTYYKCAELIKQAKNKNVPDFEKSFAYVYLLDIYKNSECYSFSEYIKFNKTFEDLVNIFEKTKEQIKLEKLKSVFNNYFPVIDVLGYFRLEPKLELISI